VDSHFLCKLLTWIYTLWSNKTGESIREDLLTQWCISFWPSQLKGLSTWDGRIFFPLRQSDRRLGIRKRMPHCLYQDRDMSMAFFFFFFLLLSLTNCKPQAQQRISGLELQWEPRQLCNILTWLRNPAISSSATTCAATVPLQTCNADSHFKLLSTAKDWLCTVCYATPTLSMQIHRHKWLATFWAVVMETVQDNVHTLQEHNEGM